MLASMGGITGAGREGYTCVAARVSMMTGRYPSASHVRSNHNVQDAYYTQDMFDVFRQNGYAIGLCGKNHSHKTQQDADFWFPCDHNGVPAALLAAEDEKWFSQYMKSLRMHLSMAPTTLSNCRIFTTIQP